MPPAARRMVSVTPEFACAGVMMSRAWDIDLSIYPNEDAQLEGLREGHRYACSLRQALHAPSTTLVRPSPSNHALLPSGTKYLGPLPSALMVFSSRWS